MTRPPVGQFNYFGALGPTLPKKHKHSVEPTLQFSDGIKLRPKLGNRFLKFGQPLVLWGNLLSRPARDEGGGVRRSQGSVWNDRLDLSLSRHPCERASTGPEPGRGPARNAV